MATAEHSRARRLRGDDEHCYSVCLPDALVAAVLRALGEDVDVSDRKAAAEHLRPHIIEFLLCKSRGSDEISVGEIRKIQARLAREKNRHA